MEPINAFAHVEDNKVKIAAPIQIPSFIIPTLESSLGITKENIEMELPRMGGGFGRKGYAHFVVEAALISQKVNAPIKLVYSREDDMTTGIYRPAYHATYRAAFDENNELTALHIKGKIISTTLNVMPEFWNWYGKNRLGTKIMRQNIVGWRPIFVITPMQRMS
jgi:isoquinoline 1-oxidoreductase beta subunit